MRRHSFERTVFAALVGITAFGLAACGGDDGPTDPLSTSTVRLELTDAPGDLDGAYIAIPQVLLVGTGGNTLIQDDNRPELISLLDLDGTTRELSETSGILPGTYGQLRIAIREALIKTQSGEVYSRFGAEDPEGAPRTGDLTCLICNQTPEGLPVFLGGEGLVLEGGDTVTIVIDFDAFRSFERSGDEWDMDPTMGGAVKGRTGTVSGTVEIPSMTPVPGSCGGRSTLEAFTPVLVDPDNSLASWSGRVQPDGTFEIDLVPAGNYEIDFVRTVEFENETLTLTASSSPFGSLTVEEGETTTLDYSISGGNCEAGGAD